MNTFDIIYYDSVNGKDITIFKIKNDITTINGGNDLDLFDIDVDNDKELIHDEIKPKQNQKPKINKIIQTIIVTDFIFFPEDTFYDFKIKVFLIFKKYLNITLYPFLQHLYINPESPTALPYKIEIDKKDIVININSKKEKYIKDIPIDIDIYNNRDEILIRGKDNELMIERLENKFKVDKIYIVNLLDYDLDNVSDFIKNDKTQLDIIYYSFINIYFPMINLEIFDYLLTNKNNISFNYPDLFLNYETTLSIYQNQIKL